MGNSFEAVSTPVLEVMANPFQRTGADQGNFSQYAAVFLADFGAVELMRQQGKTVFCLAEEQELGDQSRLLSFLLKQPPTEAFMKKFSGSAGKDVRPVIVPFRTSPFLESFCRNRNWILAAASVEVFKKLDNKSNFKGLLRELGLPVLPFQTLRLEELNYEKLKDDFRKDSQDLVIQMPSGRGEAGTFFVRNENDFSRTRESLQEKAVKWKQEEGEDLKVVVSPFIHGYSICVTAVATRWGTIQLPAHLQLIDIKEVNAQVKGQGVFCGNDWTASNGIDPALQEKAAEITEKIGQAVKELGFRGVFGIDFLVNQHNGQLYPLEINPRFVGAFPVSASVQRELGETPIVDFHVREFLNWPGLSEGLDIESINRSFADKREGAHVVLHVPQLPFEVKQGLEPGVYQLEQGKLKFLRSGLGLSDIKAKGEFVLTNFSFKGPTVFTKEAGRKRLLRVVARETISQEMGNKANDFLQAIAAAVYGSL